MNIRVFKKISTKSLQAGLIACFCVLPLSAYADALDGDWCNKDNEKLTIEGSTVTTPNGDKISGNYGRHQMTFDTPSGGWRAGSSILMQQHSEESMSMYTKGTNSISSEPWTRCGVIS